MMCPDRKRSGAVGVDVVSSAGSREGWPPRRCRGSCYAASADDQERGATLRSVTHQGIAHKESALAELLDREEGFQTAEAIGISAVGLLVLFAIWGALSVLGVDVIDWIRATFGVGAASPLPPPTG